MAETEIGCDESTADAAAAANSGDTDRVYALSRVLSSSGIDEFLESPEFPPNDFVAQIIDVLDNQSSAVLKKERFGIDFSSPNVAKPFHIGHLRSTFIGRAISNMLLSTGSQVRRINYLGDWGTQFGLLATGANTSLLQNNNKEDGNNNLSNLRRYFEQYVKANERAENDAEFRQQALDYFVRLENGTDQDALKFWRRVVDESVDELKQLYARLNVEFDAWESENAAALPAKILMKELDDRGILERTEENVVGVRVNVGPQVHFVPLVKSDGATLYLTRDVHSALHRFDHYGCKRLIYVTDARQQHHFLHLKAVLAKIGREDVANVLLHLSYGRVRGMSTRKGVAVFVDDLLAEGTKRAEAEILTNDPHTKTPPGTVERSRLADQLTLTGLIVNDLRKRRSLEYDFDWQHVLETKKDGGVGLQKTFCRLSSICDRCAASAGGAANLTVDSADTFRRSVNERASLELIALLSRRLAPALIRSYEELEMYPLTQYLFRLRKLCGGAVQGLRVADAPTPALRSSRFLLFDVSRKVLGLGIRLLGAKPLAKI